jgi:hypothetical protein
MRKVPMQERPLSITAIAILQFVFGGLALLCGIGEGAGLLVGGGGQKWFASSGGPGADQDKVDKLADDLEKAIESGPAYQAVQVGSLVIYLALSVAMIISGIGLLQLRPWGRLLSIGYALADIALTAFRLVYAVAFTIPAFRDLVNKHPVETAEEQMVIGVMGMMAYLPPILELVWMIYPVIILIIMFRAANAAAFQEEGARHPLLPKPGA